MNKYIDFEYEVTLDLENKVMLPDISSSFLITQVPDIEITIHF